MWQELRQNRASVDDRKGAVGSFNDRSEHHKTVSGLSLGASRRRIRNSSMTSEPESFVSFRFIRATCSALEQMATVRTSCSTRKSEAKVIKNSSSPLPSRLEGIFMARGACVYACSAPFSAPTTPRVVPSELFKMEAESL
jgi:hypothetical protein